MQTQICQIGNFPEKKKPKLGTENALFRYFCARTLKNYCHILGEHPGICEIAKFCEKTSFPKFVTKNALFGYYWARILKKLLSYLKSAY